MNEYIIILRRDITYEIEVNARGNTKEQALENFLELEELDEYDWCNAKIIHVERHEIWPSDIEQIGV